MDLIRDEEYEHEHEPQHEHEQQQEIKPEHDHVHRHEHGLLDPHIWLDFGLDQIIIDKLIRKTTELLPDEAAYFKANGEDYKKRLQELDRQFKKTLAGCKQRAFIMGGACGLWLSGEEIPPPTNLSLRFESGFDSNAERAGRSC